VRILWMPHTGWHIPQRAHLFARALAQRHEVHVTDWVADFSGIRDYCSIRYLRNYTYRRYRDGAVLVHGIPRISPALPFPVLRRLNTRIFSAMAQRIIARHRIDVVVGTFVVPPPRAPRVIFDLSDDNVAYWRSFGRVPEYADEIASVEQAYLRSADATVAISSVLVEKAQALGARGPVHHIPNAIDLRNFDSVGVSDIRRQLGVNGPLVGSIGSHDKPAELDKLLDAAALLASDNISVLIAGRGTAVPAAREQAQQRGLSNIHFIGPIPQTEAIRLTRALDAGICPYLKTPGADASSPMRILMYTAAGIPVVCTDLEEVRRMRFPNVVLVADHAPALAEGIRAALQVPRGRPPEIEAYDLTRLVAQYEAVLQGTIDHV
jgi:glycosyltransferase involved in cell wall biosynthesis